MSDHDSYSDFGAASRTTKAQACIGAISATQENPITTERLFTELGPGSFSGPLPRTLITTSVAIPLAVTGLTLLRDARHSPTRKRLS